MKLTNNTILITGGGTGIGRGLAEALHARGNKVIIAGRELGTLTEVANKNPGMVAVKLNIRDAKDIEHVAKELISQYPDLNVLMNNAGIMHRDDAAKPLDDEKVLSQIDTNMVGSIQMTGAFIEHLKSKPEATIVYTSSSLAFTPLALYAVYCATKAALHSYAMSQRFKLRHTSVRVQEIAPPYIATTLGGNDPNDRRAVPVGDFINELMPLLGSDAEELVVPQARQLRDNAGPGEHKYFRDFNEMGEKEWG